MKNLLSILSVTLLISCGGGGTSHETNPLPNPASSGSSPVDVLTHTNQFSYPGDERLGRLVRQANTVVLGEVIRVESRWETGPGGLKDIYSYVTLSVDETLKGSAFPTIILRTLGGTVGDMRIEVSHQPALFYPGEQVLLFLKRHQRSFTVIGGEWGKIVVNRGAGHIRFSNRQLSFPYLKRVVRP